MLADVYDAQARGRPAAFHEYSDASYQLYEDTYSTEYTSWAECY